MELKRFNVSWIGGQLERTVLETDILKAKEYMEKKYPKRKIKEIEEMKTKKTTERR